MLKINSSKLFDKDNNLVAIQIPIEDFNRLEEVIEDYGLGKLIDDSQDDDVLTVNEAKVFYNQLPDSE